MRPQGQGPSQLICLFPPLSLASVESWMVLLQEKVAGATQVLLGTELLYLAYSCKGLRFSLRL